jgi:hypothetical protein
MSDTATKSAVNKYFLYFYETFFTKPRCYL